MNRSGRRAVAPRSLLLTALALTVVGAPGAAPLAALQEADEAAETVAAQDTEAAAGGAEEAAEEAGDEESPAPPASTATEPDLSRIRFDVPFTGAGGGVARGSAGALEYMRPDYVILTGGVEFAYSDMKLQAERVEIDLATRQVIALGQVILDQGPRRMTAATLDYNLATETGTLTDAHAFVDPDMYFSGREISKISEDTYLVKHGVMTSCHGDSPPWSFRLGKGRVRVGGYAKATNATLRVKKLPVLYSPFVMYPAEQGRKSGFLMPSIGNSRTRGNVLGISYYQTMGRSYDATLTADIYEQDFLGLGTEFRYNPLVGTRGYMRGYAIDDPVADEVRWKAEVFHESTNLPGGMRGVVRALEYSDFEFFRDFERDFNEIAVRTINSYGFVTGNWGSQSFNLMLNQSETFIRQGVTVEQSQLPEVEYKLRSTQLGSLPLYFQLDSSAHYFNAKRTGVFDESWGRADLLPRLTVPLSRWPWLSMSVTGGGRVTYYQDSLDESGKVFTGEPLTRFLPTANAEVVGPSFSRIYDWKIGRFGKFKHVIEPRWAYLFVDEFDDQNLVPLFDEIDRLNPQNLFAVSLVNRLLAKPKDEDSLEGAREILLIELTQPYSLDNDRPLQLSRDRTMQASKGPISGRIRFNPGTRVNLEQRFSYNTLFNGLESSSLSGTLGLGRNSLGLSWFTRRNAELDKTTSNQGRVFTQIELIRNRLRLGSQVNYDFNNSLLQAQRHVLNLTSQCWGFSLEFRELRTLQRLDRDFRFAVSLKNIGTLVDLTSGTREEF